MVALSITETGQGGLRRQMQAASNLYGLFLVENGVYHLVSKESHAEVRRCHPIAMLRSGFSTTPKNIQASTKTPHSGTYLTACRSSAWRLSHWKLKWDS